MERIIESILAILLFFCLADMPYGYYQFVRFAGLIVYSGQADPSTGILTPLEKNAIS